MNNASDTTYNEYPKIKKFLNRNYHYYLFTIILFITGYISGNAISYELNNKKLLGIINPILNIVKNMRAEKSFLILTKSFFTHFVYIFATWFLSLTIIGIILVMFIVFFNGFMYGVVIGSFSYQLSLQGFLVGFFYTFPQNIMIVPLLIYISSNSIRLSIVIFKSFITSSSRKVIKHLLNEYYNKLFFAIGVLIIYALIMAIFGNKFLEILKSLI